MKKTIMVLSLFYKRLFFICCGFVGGFEFTLFKYKDV